jgi:hypothetical protein
MWQPLGSQIEKSDFRAISKPVAKKLAAIFHVSVDRFI